MFSRAQVQTAGLSSAWADGSASHSPRWAKVQERPPVLLPCWHCCSLTCIQFEKMIKELIVLRLLAWYVIYLLHLVSASYIISHASGVSDLHLPVFWAFNILLVPFQTLARILVVHLRNRLGTTSFFESKPFKTLSRTLKSPRKPQTISNALNAKTPRNPNPGTGTKKGPVI